ncbi:MAG TPA: response regulator [Thermodesulfobacteriota bacterium]
MMPRVVIVEGEADIAPILRAALESAGYELVVVSTVGEARAVLADARPPALLLVDVALPDGDGLEVCRLAQARWPTRPIIVCTAAASTEMHARAVLAGASAYLARPFDRDALLALVDQLLDRKRSRAS